MPKTIHCKRSSCCKQSAGSLKGLSFIYRMDRTKGLFLWSSKSAAASVSFMSRPRCLPNPSSYSAACTLIYKNQLNSTSDAMPQPPGTRTTHHCPGAKVKMYIKLGACRVDRGCCRTHQLRCQEPECKGWIYLKHDRCIKCEHRAKVSPDVVPQHSIYTWADW